MTTLLGPWSENSGHVALMVKRARQPNPKNRFSNNRYIIAAAIIAGIKIAAVAKQLAASRSWSSREANALGTRQLLAELLVPYRERMKEVFGQVLEAMKDALEARKIFVVKGVIVDGGPDHYARLEAVKMFILLMRHAGNGQAIRPGPSAGGA
jgi:hypothetical protein